MKSQMGDESVRKADSSPILLSLWFFILTYHLPDCRGTLGISVDEVSKSLNYLPKFNQDDSGNKGI